MDDDNPEPDSVELSDSMSPGTFRLNHQKLINLAQESLHGLGLQQFGLSLAFVDPQQMHQLNKEFRDRDKSTDVLSFAQQRFERPVLMGELPEVMEEDGGMAFSEAMSDGQESPLGDVVVSPADAWANANAAGTDFDLEIATLIVHGVLHLCGHDHELPDEEKIMFDEQRKLLAMIKEKQDPPLWHGCVERDG